MRDLSKYEIAFLEKAKDKVCCFEYNIADCENRGDLHRAEYYCEQICKKYGGKITNSYWDGRDCGEAYITCEFPYDKVERVMREDVFFYSPYIKY